MKKYFNILTVSLLLIFSIQISYSQNTDKSWSFEAGFSAINLYPVGENAPQGEYFDEFLNLNDHFNFGAFVGVTRNFTENLSFTAKATTSEISKWGDFGRADESVLVDNLKYYGLDGMINYAFGKSKLQPFIAVGGGYTWIEEGMFNTLSTENGSDNLIGAGTVNGSVGLKYNVNSRFAINLQTTYKHSFEDYLSKHWAHNLGLSYRLSNDKMEKEDTSSKTSEAKEVSRWSFETGFSAIDLYPVGEDAPQGEYFDEFFNLNDHYNIGVFVGVTRNISKNLSFTAKGTINEISKWGQFGNADESVLVDNLKYYGLDGMVNYAFGKNKLQPFIAIGGGYTWIEEGPFNTFSAENGTKNLVGAGTVNGSVGLKYAINEDFGVNLQTTYKHSFEEYLPKHFSHSLGVVYNLGNGQCKKEVEEEVSNDRDGDGVPNQYDLCPDIAGLASMAGCPDTDGDGITDADDLCPEIKGSIAFGGCVDTDGDGFPDNTDNCPKVKGTDNGCPAEVKEIIKNVGTPIAGERKVYFNYNSAELDRNAKIILDDLAKNMTSDSSYSISVIGHTDSKGTESYNNSLSTKRAQAIRNYLVSKGISSAAITTTGAGESQPVSSNNTESGRADNRRAVLIIKVN